jgi:hypothetical protein
MLTATDFSILTNILARTDALFSPMRVWKPMRLIPSNGVLVAIQERRAAFATEGVEYTTSGTSNERKEAERQLGALQSWGYLHVSTKTGRRIGVRLTDKGDDVARDHCCMPLYAQSHQRLLLRMKVLLDHDVCWNGMTTEDDLCGGAYETEWGVRAVCELEAHAAPLLARGLIDELVRCGGWVGYQLTEAGTAALADKPVCPELKGGTDFEGYCALFDAYLEARQSWKPRRHQEVYIPLPAGADWPQRTWADLPRRLRANHFKTFAKAGPE